MTEWRRVVDSVRVEQELAFGDGGYVVESMTLVLDEGLGFRADIDQNTASLVPFLDGTRTLRQAIDDAAHARGVDREDLQAFASGALALVKTMLELGFLSGTERSGGYPELSPSSPDRADAERLLRRHVRGEWAAPAEDDLKITVSYTPKGALV